MKMGRNKYIETPVKMLELFQAYAKEVKANPRTKMVFGGKDFEERVDPLERPLTMCGFEVYIMNLEGVESRGVDQYFSNEGDRYSDYVGVCSRIRKIIRQDQIEGGSVGQYNASITQRLTGLVDKKEIDAKIEPRVFNIEYKK